MPGILIVDDAAFMRIMLKDLLSKNGYEVTGEAVNGIEAVEQYKNISPDLVIMDIIMPQEDGISALKKIMAININAKVIMCSAMGQQGTVIESIQSGAKDFIVKPFTNERLIDTVRKIIG